MNIHDMLHKLSFRHVDSRFTITEPVQTLIHIIHVQQSNNTSIASSCLFAKENVRGATRYNPLMFSYMRKGCRTPFIGILDCAAAPTLKRYIRPSLNGQLCISQKLKDVRSIVWNLTSIVNRSNLCLYSLFWFILEHLSPAVPAINNFNFITFFLLS